MYTETYKDNQCIDINTTRLHNEIIKQRISCIPVHIKLDVLPNNYIMELDVKNETESIGIVTTQDLKLKTKKWELFDRK